MTRNESQYYTKQCKHHNKHIDTIKAYIACLYTMHDHEFCTGGLLYIVTDDGNLEDHHIKWCLEECDKFPEREDSVIGKLICNELLKLPMEQRILVHEPRWVIDSYCPGQDHCNECPIMKAYLEGDR